MCQKLRWTQSLSQSIIAHNGINSVTLLCGYRQRPPGSAISI